MRWRRLLRRQRFPRRTPQPPVAANDRIRADGSDLQSIDVLANDEDPDSDTLTVTIEQAPQIGTASINEDQSIRIDELPSDFKGATRFTYRVTDPEGASSLASVAVFVGTPQFSIFFAADASAGDSSEVYVTDFASDPQLLTAATSGALRLEGFVASADGGTVVYSRARSGRVRIRPSCHSYGRTRRTNRLASCFLTLPFQCWMTRGACNTR